MFDQIVKGNVRIKKLTKHRYRITFSKIDKFLLYQTWDKDNTNNINGKRSTYYLYANDWVNLFKKHNEFLQKNDKPLFTPTTVMETQDNHRFVFIIDKAYLNYRDQVVFIVSTKEISLGNNSSKKLIKLPVGKYNNMRFDIDELNWDDGQGPPKQVGYCHYTYGHPCSESDVLEWRKTHICPGGPQYVDRTCGTGCLSMQQDWWGGQHCANY